MFPSLPKQKDNNSKKQDNQNSCLNQESQPVAGILSSPVPATCGTCGAGTASPQSPATRTWISSTNSQP